MLSNTDTLTIEASRQVMIVDDVPAIRTIARATLEHAGYDVVEAMSGEDAIAYMEQHADPLAMHAMLCDINMPGIGGQHAIRHFLKHYPWVGVIVLTGDLDMTIAYGLLKLGVAQYLIKPVAHNQLREAVDRCVTQAVAARGWADWRTTHSGRTHSELMMTGTA